jgi:hypothetical protein
MDKWDRNYCGILKLTFIDHMKVFCGTENEILWKMSRKMYVSFTFYSNCDNDMTMGT